MNRNCKDLILVTGHIAADFDAISSMLASCILLRNIIETRDFTALKRYFKNLEVRDDDSVFDNLDIVGLLPQTQYPNLVSFIEQFHESFLLKYNIQKQLTQETVSQVKYVFVVDTKRISRLKHIHNVLYPSAVTSSPSSSRDKDTEQYILNDALKSVYVCDHHPVGPEDVPTAVNTLVETVLTGANVAIIIVDMMKGRDSIKLSDMEATVMAIGVYEDTGKFTFGSTSHREFSALEYLTGSNTLDMSFIKRFMSAGNAAPQAGAPSMSSQDKSDDSQQSHTPSANNVNNLMVLESMTKTLSKTTVSGHDVYCCDMSAEYSKHSLSPLIQLYIEMNQHIHTMIVFVRAEESGTVVICRTTKDSPVDVGKLCENVGGGGHKCAASVTLKDSTLSEAKNIVFAMIYGALVGSQVKVKDAMTANALVASYDSTLAELDTMFNSNALIKYLLVTNDRNEIGQISRNQVQYYALNESNMGQKISDLLEIDIAQSVSSTSTLQDITYLMTSKDQWIVPVIDDNQSIVGVVSVTDILKNILRSMESKIFIEEKRDKKDVTTLLNTKVPGVVTKFTSLLHDLCNEFNVNIYIVGSTVADLLTFNQQSTLPNEKYNSVLVVDSKQDKESIINSMIEYIKKKSDWTIEQKDTCLVASKKSYIFKISLVNNIFYPNSEYIYTFQPSDIKSYCYSKLYTCNTIVISLKSYDLFDYFLGRDDLDEKVLRTLHSTSFIDHPKTLLDILLDASKKNFKISRETKKYIKYSTIQMSAAKKISGRMFMEFFEKMFGIEGQDYIAILKDMQIYNILQEISPNLQINNRLYNHVEETLQWYHGLHIDHKPNLVTMRLSVLLQGSSPKVISSIHDRLDLSEEERALYNDLGENAKVNRKLIKKWIQDSEDSEGNIETLYTILSPLSLECILLMLATLMDEQEARPRGHKSQLFLLQAPFSLYFNHSQLSKKRAN